jgi:hypothetical protein
MFLPYQIKLAAIELKYFKGYQWEPKLGDYFTNVTNDFDLYQILDDDGDVFTILNTCGVVKPIKWRKDDFVNGEFFKNRVHIPSYMLKFFR